MRRYAFVQQASEEDCGAACVAMVARHYGKKVPMPLVRNLIGTGRQGTTLLGLRRGTEELGFHARALRTDLDDTFFRDVHQLSLPVILYWEGHHLSSFGTSLSILRRKLRNSWCRCLGLHSAITAPVATSRAANRVVVPWRMVSCVTPST